MKLKLLILVLTLQSAFPLIGPLVAIALIVILAVRQQTAIVFATGIAQTTKLALLRILLRLDCIVCR